MPLGRQGVPHAYARVPALSRSALRPRDRGRPCQRTHRTSTPFLGSRFDDVLTGSDANNTFQTEGGNDTIDGGGGLDFASFARSPGPVTVDLAAGTATGEGTDTLTGIENVFGSDDFGDTLMGDTQDNALFESGGDDSVSGSDGNDALDGGNGTDALDGGIGTDTCLNGETIANCEA
jgi:Ca2+-binding RTX toxin-like protein